MKPRLRAGKAAAPADAAPVKEVGRLASVARGRTPEPASTRREIRGTRNQVIAPATDTPQVRVEPIDFELQRLLRNWMDWRSGGGSIARFSAYSAMAGLGAHGTRDEAAIPSLAIDADRVNRAVESLDGEHRNALVHWWSSGGSLRAKAKACGCGQVRLIALVNESHRLLKAALARGFS